MKNILIWGGVVILIIIGAVYWFVVRSAGPAAGPAATQSQSLGATLYDSAAATPNPTEKMQETNPFSAPTNPVKDAYQNPF